jgi:DNA primase
VIGFGARALQSGQEPKYLNSPESAVYRKRSFLFGYEQARRAIEPGGEVVVVEGYFDAIGLAQAGARNVVATSGTALTPEHAKLLQRAVTTVVLTFDADSAGQDAMLRSLGTLLAAGLEVRVAELPAGEDPDSLVRNGGIDAWRAVREAALDPVDYVQKHGYRKAGPGDPRERALQIVVELATAIPDPLRQRLFLERAGQVFGIAERVLARAAGLKKAGHRSDAPIQAAVRVQARGAGWVERQLLQGVLHAPEHLDEARAHLSPQDFLDPACRALAEVLWGDAPAGDEAAALERELLASPEDELDWGAIAAGALKRMLRRNLERERREIQQRLLRVQRDRPDDEAAGNALLAEYQRLTERMGEMDRAEIPSRGVEHS